MGKKLLDSINLSEWNTPNTYDSQYEKLPEMGGVYLLVLRELFPDSLKKSMILVQTILYVGSSHNLYQRCVNHPVKNLILKNYKSDFVADIACYFKICEDYIAEEKRLIKLTQARYNKQWR